MVGIQTVEDVKQLGTILSVWAHPDDESFSSAGLMVAAVQNGQQVICATATKGELGVQDAARWPVDKLGDIRAAELRATLNILGVKTHHWLGYHDGQCQEVPLVEGAGKVLELIERYQPRTILTFPPDGITGHLDHQAISKWVSQATRSLDIQLFHVANTHEQYEQFLKAMDEKINIFYNIDQPNLVEAADCAIHLQLPDAIIQLKCQALKAMPSQYDALHKCFPTDFLCHAFATEAFVRADKAGR